MLNRDVKLSYYLLAYNVVYVSVSVHLCSIRGDIRCHEPMCLAPNTAHNFCIFSVVFSQDSNELLGGYVSAEQLFREKRVWYDSVIEAVVQPAGLLRSNYAACLMSVHAF